MGQGFSLFNNDDINLNAYKTENFSSTIPYERKLYADANTLVNRLGHNRTQFSMWDDLMPSNYKMYQQSAEVENDNNFSDTSPFITSDVYNNISNQQLGGDLDNSTSSTSASSSTDSSSTSDKKKKKHKKEESFSGKDKKKDKKKKHKKSPIEEDSDDESSDNSSEEEEEHDEEESEKEEDDDVYSGMSSNVLSYSEDSNNTYESSSAHTDNIDTNTDVTTVSAKYYRNHSAMSDSINTSDINIISVEN